jgi:putative nucleotidyltransferase with HDIG domain
MRQRTRSVRRADGPTHLTDVLRLLDERPRQVWPDAVVHHGFRIVLMLLLVVLFQLLFPLATTPDVAEHELGSVPTEDIIAADTFPLRKTAAELAQEREEAAAAVAPVFVYDPSAIDTMLARVRHFIVQADSAAQRGVTDVERRVHIRELLTAQGFPINDEAVELLLNAQQRQQLQRVLEQTITGELLHGVASSTDFEENTEPQWRVLRNNTEQLVPRDSIRAGEASLSNRAAEYLPPSLPPGFTEFHSNALIRFFQPSIKFHAVRTDEARMQAQQAVDSIKGEVVLGERVIAAHERIGERELERLTAYRDFLRRSGQLGGRPQYREQAGMFVLNLLILAVFGFLLLSYRPTVYEHARHVTVIVLLIAALAFGAAAVDTTDAPVELVPIAFATLVVAALWDGRMALNFVLVVATLLSIQTPFQTMSARLLMLVGGSAAALSVRVMHRRSQGLVLGILIGAAYSITCVGLGLLFTREAGEVLTCALWGFANGVASALIAMGFLPVFEAFTRITTDQTLLELADLNRPLLKRLSLEASGTYAHSINVANLTEAAARGIGANPLLARVGAYYHDVGKIALPQYFIENQPRGRNPHDQLDPRRSAEIVRLHVLEGMKLAEQAGLPESVCNFIPEHHGTQSIGFFYDQARHSSPEAELDPADFTYPGPKPQSKETAILMFADSVESAAKALQEPTPERIRALVDRIVDGKISQGQADESPLTLQDITRIKEQFVAVLTGMYHYRIDYPPQRPASAPPEITTSSGRRQL